MNYFMGHKLRDLPCRSEYKSGQTAATKFSAEPFPFWGIFYSFRCYSVIELLTGVPNIGIPMYSVAV